MPRHAIRHKNRRETSIPELPAWFMKLEPRPWVLNLHSWLKKRNTAQQSGHVSTSRITQGSLSGSEIREPSNMPSMPRNTAKKHPRTSSRGARKPSKKAAPWRRYLERIIEADIRAYFAAHNGGDPQAPIHGKEQSRAISGPGIPGPGIHEDYERGAERHQVDGSQLACSGVTHHGDDNLSVRHPTPAPEHDEPPQAVEPWRSQAKGADPATARSRSQGTDQAGEQEQRHHGRRKRHEIRHSGKSAKYNFTQNGTEKFPPRTARHTRTPQHRDARSTIHRSPPNTHPPPPLLPPPSPPPFTNPRPAPLPPNHNPSQPPSLAKQLLALVIQNLRVRTKFEGRQLAAAKGEGRWGGGGGGGGGGERAEGRGKKRDMGGKRSSRSAKGSAKERRGGGEVSRKRKKKVEKEKGKKGKTRKIARALLGLLTSELGLLLPDPQSPPSPSSPSSSTPKPAPPAPASATAPRSSPRSSPRAAALAAHEPSLSPSSESPVSGRSSSAWSSSSSSSSGRGTGSPVRGTLGGRGSTRGAVAAGSGDALGGEGNGEREGEGEGEDGERESEISLLEDRMGEIGRMGVRRR